MRELIVSWPRPLRLLVGVIACAAAAHYVPLLAITLTGIYTNLIFSGLDLLIEGGVLVVVSLVGYATRRVWLVSLVVCFIFGVYEVQHYSRAPVPFSIRDRWPELALAFGSLLLNAYLFSRYVSEARLGKSD